LCAHDEGRPLQFINFGLAVCYLAELNTMLTERVFKFSQPETHLQDLWLECHTEAICLFC